MEVCRACLCVDKDLFQVDKDFISSYNLLTSINVGPYDSRPQRFCQSCMETVRCFIAFRDKCISSESTLQEKNMNKNDECQVEVAIKQETESYLDDSSQYELTEYNVQNEMEKQDSCVTKNETMGGKELKLLELEVVKRPRGRPRKTPTSELLQQQQVQKLTKMHNAYYCGLCDKSFNILDHLYTHLDGHRNDDCCGICFKSFENWPKLLAHRTMHSAKKFCHICPRRFHSLFKLEQHYLHVHFEEKLKEMCCENCQKTFTCPDKFRKHLETHNVECHLCPQVFPSKRRLLVHLRIHEQKKRFQCDQCEYTAIYAAVLDIHKKRRHKKYCCKTCGRKFSEWASLKKHTCKDKSKLCPICGQHIYESFKRHLNSHQDVKAFKCEKCPATYKSPLSLKVHMDRHANNPTHVCDYCGRKFYYPGTLSKHRRVHTGEKPYACKMCGKRFTGNSNLRVHMKTHGIMLINKRNNNPFSDVVVFSG